MKQLATLSLSTLALALGLAGPAQAGRPFATEDAGVLDRGGCEWEGVAGRAKAADSATVNLAATQVACGLGWRSQLGLAFQRSSAEGESASSWGLNGKTRLGSDTKAPLQLTLAWGAATLKEPGGSHRHDTSYLNLVASHAYDSGWTAHANLGTVHSRAADAATTTWALAAEKAMGGGLDLGAELYGDDRSEPWLGLGLRWALNDSVTLYGSWARQGGAERARLMTAGFKFNF